MAMEETTTSLVAQMTASGIDLLAKQVDVLESIIDSRKDELEKYAADSVGTGKGVIQVNVPTRDLLKLQSKLHSCDIPFANDISNQIKFISNPNEELGDLNNPISKIYIRDIDLNFVQDQINKLGLNWEELSEFENEQTTKSFFDNVETCFIDNLSPIKTEIIAKEFEVQGVNFQRLYDKETNMMSLEIEASMFNRLGPNTLSRAERALHDASIKSLSTDYVYLINHDVTLNREIEAIFEKELNPEFNADRTLGNSITVFDSAEPHRNIKIENKAAVFYENDKQIAIKKLENEKELNEVKESIKLMAAPVIRNTTEYVKAINLLEKKDEIENIKKSIKTKKINNINLTEIDKQGIKKIKDYENAQKMLKGENSRRFGGELLKNDLDKICETSRKEKLLDINVNDVQEGINQRAIEIKIPNSDKLFDTVIPIMTETQEQYNQIEDVELKSDIRKQISEMISLKTSELSVTNPEMHTTNPAYIYITDHERNIIENNEEMKKPIIHYDEDGFNILKKQDRDRDRDFDRDGIPDRLDQDPFDNDLDDAYEPGIDDPF